MGLGGGKNELDVWRRLFERLEECIKGRVGQHVDFIDDDDSEATLGRPVLDTFGKVTDVIDSRMRSAVNLQHVDGAAGGDLSAIAADVTGVRGWAVFAIECFGEYAGGGGLADAARAGEQKG